MVMERAENPSTLAQGFRKSISARHQHIEVFQEVSLGRDDRAWFKGKAKWQREPSKMGLKKSLTVTWI